MFKLNQKSKNRISKSVGLPFEQVVSMDVEDLDNQIEKQIGKKLYPSYRKGNTLINRGSVYMYLQRLISRSSIDEKLSKI